MTCPPCTASLRRRVSRRLALVGFAIVCAGAGVLAQAPADSRPAFQLSSSQIFTTRASPSIYLTFARVTALDVRIYKVNDPIKFFSSLEDPHVLGSPEPVVPQEETWLERIAYWKARQRSALRSTMRRQLSPEYRRVRREVSDSSAIVQRRTVGYTEFAQVPVLNQQQLVASWRELLPNVREAEVRRLPLQLPGAGVYVVEAVSGPLKAYTVVVVSDVALVTKTAPGQIVAFAVQRETGTPVADCDLTALLNQKAVASARTGADGVAELTFPVAPADSVTAVGRCGDAVALADPGAWLTHARERELKGFVFTDRPIYRPTHVVNVKAWLRWKQRGLLLPFDRTDAEIVITDVTDKVVLRQSRPVDKFGGIDTSFTLPADAALGAYTVNVQVDDETAYGSFEVEEYRKPEFEVSVRAGAPFVVQGESVRATIQARYYFGQPVSRGQVKYALFRTTYYSPLRWHGDDNESPEGGYGGYAGDQVGEGTAALDGTGTAAIDLTVPVSDDGLDSRLQIKATVTDESGREVDGTTTVIGTIGTFALVADVDRYVYPRGAAGVATVRALDYHGQPRPNVTAVVALEQLTYPNGRYDTPRASRIDGTEVATDAEGRVTWQFRVPAQPGDYRIRVSARAGPRDVSDTASVWVPGGGETMYDEGDRFLELVADRRRYAPGDVARVMIRGDDANASILITKERDRTTSHRVARETRTTEPIEIPITEDDIGDIWVNVAFVRGDRLYRAEQRLSVPATSKVLDITVVPAAAVSQPRDPGIFTIRTRTAAGIPVSAEVAVAVVDEALYGVKRDTTPDPARFFYRNEYSRVATRFSPDYSFVGYSGTHQMLLAQRRRPLSLADFKADVPDRQAVRRTFPDAIYWTANLVTNQNGEATVKVAYPDALTAWRVTARAITADTDVGTAVARTTVTKDVIVRPIVPRFLTQGDRLDLPVIGHNYLSTPANFTLTTTATGLTPAPSNPPAPHVMDVAAGGEVRASWSFDATEVGTAAVSTSFVGATDRDDVELTFPVQPRGLKRDRGVSGSILDPVERTVTLDVPEQSNPAARTITVTLAPSLGGSLLGALDFLTAFPYGCTEQTVSSFLPNLLVIRALGQIGLQPTARLASVNRMSQSGLTRLADLQHDDGGFGWWKTDASDPFMTAYATYALVTAQRTELTVDRWKTVQAVSATARLAATYPQMVPDLRAYLVWVLSLAAANGIVPNDPWDGPGELNKLWDARDRMTSHGRAILLLTLDAGKDARGDELAKTLLAEAQTKGELSWWPGERDTLLDDVGDATAEATAFAVKALAARAPTEPTLERAVRWLLANRTGSYWGTTKQTAMALYGLLEFLEARRETPTTVAVDVVVNGAAAGTHQFTPESWTAADPVVLSVPATAGTNTIVIRTRTPGAVYWTASAVYYDTREPIEATGSSALALSRRYSKLSTAAVNGKIVYRESPFDGNVVPGDLILVRLAAAGARTWRYLVVEDPIPAGTEAVTNPESYPLEKAPAWWWGSRREYRDNRVVIFQNAFTDGRYDYSYLLKVVTPGRFSAMPAQICPMYVPGVTASTTTIGVDVGALPAPAPAPTPEAKP